MLPVPLSHQIWMTVQGGACLVFQACHAPTWHQRTSKSISSVEGFNLYDYLTGNASVYANKDRRITPCTGAQSSISSQFQGSDKVPTKESSLLGFMLSDNKVGGAISWLLTGF